MGWGPIPERIEQEAELLPRLLVTDTKQFEKLLLNFPAVDTNTSARDLVPVQYEIVCAGSGVARRSPSSL